MNYCRDFRETGPRRGTKKIEIIKKKKENWNSMGLFVDYSRGEAVYLWGSDHELSTPENSLT